MDKDFSTRVAFMLVILCCGNILEVETKVVSFRSLWTQLVKCEGVINLRCRYLSHYCNVEVLKRGETNFNSDKGSSDYDEQDFNELGLVKKAKEVRMISMNCASCNKYCW
uniref:Uncharacterized LOC100180524 n=1 Tax=Ciona intestinalis TaxID=7719 RepID=H2XQZ6_CIOIN|nr:uncharacterized protein LOC100180524 [Ciona intestinalis]|eukprot:XP_002126332.1 uncharacterized protein LOC100180524 [Ciona intestinalis]